MDQGRPTRKQLFWELMGIRAVGRTGQRWQEDVLLDLKQLEVINWKETAKYRRTARDLAKKANKRVIVPNDDDDDDDDDDVDDDVL